jgi:hypothetical protein
MKKKNIKMKFFRILKVTEDFGMDPDPDPHPHRDPFVRGTDLRIWNTDVNKSFL